MSPEPLYFLDVEQDCVYELVPVPDDDETYKQQPKLGAGFQRFVTADELDALDEQENMYRITRGQVDALEAADKERARQARELLETSYSELLDGIEE